MTRTRFHYVLFCLLAQSARAQLPPFAQLARQPADVGAAAPALGSHTAQLRQAVSTKKPPQGVALGRGPWIVFSDRDANVTYRAPGPTGARFRQMRFREAFYVLKEKNGYLKLLRYDPALPVGSWYAPRLLRDRKKAVYYGWAPKANLLLTTRAFADTATGRPQLVCAALTHPRLLQQPTTYLSRDTLRLYAHPTPDRMAPAGLRLYELAYVYKLSASGRQALVGTSPWFPADSIGAHVLGWAPTEALQPLGSGLFLEADTVGFSTAPLPLYAGPRLARPNVVKTPAPLRPDERADAGATPPDGAPAHASADTPTMLRLASQSQPLRSAPDSLRADSLPAPIRPDGAFATVPWARAGLRLPVLRRCCPVADAPDQAMYQIGLLSALYQTDSSVLNVDGRRLTYRHYMALAERSRRYNIVYVVQADRVMRPYWAELVSTVQAAAPLLHDSTGGRQYRVGAVLYKELPGENGNRNGRTTTQPLTPDLARVVDFMRNTRVDDDPTPATLYQPIRLGVERALSLLAAHPDENNVIILVGINGDSRDISQLANVRAGLQQTGARLLSFQVFAPSDTLANSYVLQSRQLAMQSAVAGGRAKRERLVGPEGIVANPEFDLSLGIRNTYQLAFPERSMVPGWVLFPRKNQLLPLAELHAITDSLLRQIERDNARTLAALARAFGSMGRFRSRLSPPVVQALAETAPTAGAGLYAYRAFPYYGRAYAPLPDPTSLRSAASSAPPTTLPGVATTLSGMTSGPPTNVVTTPAAPVTPLKQIRLLAADDYVDVGLQLDQLAADAADPGRATTGRFADRQALAQAFRRLATRLGLSHDVAPGRPATNADTVGRSNATTFGQPAATTSVTVGRVLGALLGLPCANPLLNAVPIADFTDPDRLPDGRLLRLLFLLRERRDYYQRIPTFVRSRFVSNGRTYYWVSEDLLR